MQIIGATSPSDVSSDFQPMLSRDMPGTKAPVRANVPPFIEKDWAPWCLKPWGKLKNRKHPENL